MINKFGSAEQKEKLLPAMWSGSDAGSLVTRAELDTATDEYVINGGKAFISGAGSHVVALYR
eukprot:gene30531-39788_t